MPIINVKPTHKPIKSYYTELETYAKLGAKHEGTTKIQAYYYAPLEERSRGEFLTLLRENSTSIILP